MLQTEEGRHRKQGKGGSNRFAGPLLDPGRKVLPRQNRGGRWRAIRRSPDQKVTNAGCNRADWSEKILSRVRRRSDVEGRETRWESPSARRRSGQERAVSQFRGGSGRRLHSRRVLLSAFPHRGSIPIARGRAFSSSLWFPRLTRRRLSAAARRIRSPGAAKSELKVCNSSTEDKIKELARKPSARSGKRPAKRWGIQICRTEAPPKRWKARFKRRSATLRKCSTSSNRRRFPARVR